MLLPTKEILFGTVREIRSFKWGGFFILESFKDVLWTQIQCVVKDKDLLSSLSPEMHIKASGQFQLSTIKKELVNPYKELIISELEILSSPESQLPINIYEREMSASLDTILNLREISIRNDKIKSILKVQSSIRNRFSEFLEDEGFTSISTPKIVKSGAEGGTNLFSVNYFGEDAFLAQSPQLYKQMACGSLGNVYEIGPVFRAEPHNTSRHINEYISLDVEMILKKSFTEIIDLEKRLLSFIFSKIPKKLIDYVGGESPTISNAVALKVSEIKQILGSSGYDLSNIEEVEICKWAKKEHSTDVVFATHYHKDVRPFYAKVSPNGEETESFDCLFRGTEITSGGQRCETYQEYVKSMNSRKMDMAPFSSYLNIFKCGMPLHGGFAIGLERLTAKICGLENIKEATLFPRDVDRIYP